MDNNLLPKISFHPFLVPRWCLEDVMQCLSENSTLLSKYSIELEAFIRSSPCLFNKLNSWHCILPKPKEICIYKFVHV